MITNQQAIEILHATVKNGGCTYDVNGSKIYDKQTGYGVAYGPQHSVQFNPNDHIHYRQWQWMLEALNMASVADFIGTWLDNGKLYIETSAVVPELADALEIAQRNEQLAIYSFADGMTINILPVEHVKS